MPTTTMRRPRMAEKYDTDIRRAAKRAQELRGSTHAICPLTVYRVRESLGNTDPMEAIQGMSIKNAKAYAGGNREVKPPAKTVELYSSIEDPFAKGRGFVAACLALAGK